MFPAFQEARIALRSLRKNPGFTTVVVLTLAIGIGANAAIFTIVNSVLLRPLPYRDPARIVNIWNDYGEGGQSLPAVSGPDFLDYRERARLFDGFAAASGATTSLTGDDRPEQVRGANITSNFFPLLGVPVELGRQLQAGEDVPNGPAVAILSYRLWRRRFGSDPSIIGRTIHLDTRPFTVVGVLPERFELLLPPEAFFLEDADIWLPQRGNLRGVPRNFTGLTVIGRLKPGITLAQAQEEMNGIAAQLRAENLVHQTSGMRIRLVPYQQDVVKGARPALISLFFAVGLVLLIACVNVANLLLARNARGSRDRSIRVALGATTGHLIRQSFTESAILAGIGAVCGVAVAELGLRLLAWLRPLGLPRLHEISLDAATLAFTAGACVLTALLFGIFPALQAARPQYGEQLKGTRNTESRERGHVQNLLVSSEIALSVVLLVGAGLLLRSFTALAQVNPGFQPDHALTFEVSPTALRFPGQNGTNLFYSQLEQKLAALPGVQKVGSISKLPFTGSGTQTPYAWNDETARKWESISADWRWATPGWLDSVGGKLSAGRWLTEQDDLQHPPVIVIDEMLARRAWPNGNWIGQRMLIAPFGTYPNLGDRMWVQVVGVVRHIRMHDLRSDIREQIFLSMAQAGGRRMSVVVRSSTAPALLASSAQAAVQSLDPDVPVAKIQTLDDLVGGARAQARFVLQVSMIFGGIAIFLVIVGLYGVISYATGQRRQEMGIRIALGAQPEQIRWLVLRRGLWLGGWGLLAGTVAALVLTRFASGLVFGVSMADPLTYLIVIAQVLLVSVVSAYIPARRAMRADPIASLRGE